MSNKKKHAKAEYLDGSKPETDAFGVPVLESAITTSGGWCAPAEALYDLMPSMSATRRFQYDEPSEPMAGEPGEFTRGRTLQRCLKAVDLLGIKVQNPTISANEAARLRGKIDGVKLAISYLLEDFV